MFCEYCGKQFPEGSKYCYYCGRHISSSAELIIRKSVQNRPDQSAGKIPEDPASAQKRLPTVCINCGYVADVQPGKEPDKICRNCGEKLIIK